LATFGHEALEIRHRSHVPQGRAWRWNKMSEIASLLVAPMMSAASTAPVSFMERGPLHETQHLDELACRRATVSLEAPAQKREAAG